jgi:beta-N-acetylhexosaminidase
MYAVCGRRSWPSCRRNAACAKHFPAHGDTSQDSHRELATVRRTREQILNSDLVPFRAAIDAGVDIVMTAHLRYPAFDTGWPATLRAP